MTIGLVLLAALAGGASAGEHGAPAKADNKSERKLTSSPDWVSLEPVIVTVLRQNRVEGMFLVEFGLDIPDETLRQKAQEGMPIMRDAYLRGMADFAATRVHIGRQADLDALTTKLQVTTDQLLGAPGAKVLLQQAVVREK